MQIGVTDMLADEWEGTVNRYHAMALYIQIVNDGVEHLTKITRILSQEGLTPPEVDGCAYLKSNGSASNLKGRSNGLTSRTKINGPQIVKSAARILVLTSGCQYHFPVV